MKTRFTALMLAAATAAAAPAADQTWTGAVDTSWFTTGNWSGSAVPGAADLAIFDATALGGLATTVDADMAVLGVKIDNAPAAVSIGGLGVLSLGAGGIDQSTATAATTLSGPVNLSGNQTWKTGPLNLITTATATLGGPGILTKTGDGVLVLAGTNTFATPVTVSQGQLTIKNNVGAGVGVDVATGLAAGLVNLADGTTFRYERTPSNGTIFPRTALTVAPGATAYLTTDNAGNGFAGPVAGAVDSVLQIGKTGALVQCSLSPGNLQQFAAFNGVVRVFEGASARFSPTSGLNNGGPNATFEINGNMTSRNGGTITLGALSGAATGSITGSTSGGNVTYSVGLKNLNTTYAGVINNNGANLINFTKTGTGTQILAGNNNYSGPTTITSGTLQLGEGGATGAIGTGTVNLVDAGSVLRVKRTGATAIAGIISGVGSLELEGSATLTLNAANTFSGPVTLKGGIAETAGLANAGSPSGIGTGSVLTLSGATLRYTGSGALTDRPLTIGGGGATLDASGTGAVEFNAPAAPVFSAANVPISLTLTGTSTAANRFVTPLSDNGGGPLSLTKTGAGTWHLPAAATITGPVNVAAGTLALTNSAGSATGSGAVSVTGTLAGTGRAEGTVTVGSGGIVSPGVNGIGDLRVGGLTLGAGSELSVGIVNASSLDKVTVLNAGGLTINGGGVRLRADGTTNPWSTPGTYNLIAYSGTVGGAATNLTVLNPVGGLTYTFGASGGFVTLTIASAGVPNTWNADLSSTWSTGASWTTGVPGGAGVQVNFLGVISAPRTVTLDAARTAGALKFDNVNSYTLDGTALLTMNNNGSPAALIADSGSHFINTPMALPSAGLLSTPAAGATINLYGVLSGASPLTQAGAGTTVLGGVNTRTGAVTLQSGTLEINSNANLGGDPVGWTGDAILRVTGNTTLTNAISIPAGKIGTVETLSVDVTASGILSGPGILAKTGEGVLTLSGVNTLGGGLLLKGGLVSYAAPANLGTGSLVFDGGGIRFAAGNTDDLSLRSLTLAAGGGTLDTAGNDVVFTAPVGNAGSGSLTKIGEGKLTLLAANTYTGRTRILDGSLAIPSVDALGPDPAAPVANQLTIDGGTLVLDSSPIDFSVNRGVAVGAGIGTIEVPGGFTLTIPAGISNRDASPGFLDLNGGGTVTLSGTGTFSGGGTFQALTINANATNCLGTGAIKLEGTTVRGGNGVNLANGFIVDGTAAINLANSSPGTALQGPLTGSGVLTLNAPYIRGGFSGNWSAFSGDLVVTGNNECRILGFTGLDKARVELTGSSSLVLAVNPPSAGTATRDIKIGALTGTGQLGGQPVPGRFVNWLVGGLNTSTTFDGVIRDGMSQTIGTGIGQAILTKEGTGTLTLTGASTYTGPTRVTDGKLLIQGDNSLATGAVTVSGGTLSGNGTVGGAVTVGAGGFLAPGETIGTLTTASATLEGALLTEYNGAGAVQLDKLQVNGDLTLGAASQLVLQPLGAFPATGSHVIATYTGTLTGTFATITGLPAGFTVNYAYNDGLGSNNIAIVPATGGQAYNTWAAAYGLTGADAGAGADPDQDGVVNVLEFATDGNPKSAAASEKTRPGVAAVGAEQALTLTLPIRTGAVFGGATAQSATVDGIVCTVEGSDDLLGWSSMVISEVTPALSAGMPALSAGYTYRTFRTPGGVSSDLQDYIRLKVAPAN